MTTERESNAERAERVFRYQSRVANQLLDHYPFLDALESADPEIIRAEATLTRECGYLSQVTLARLEGQDPSLLDRFRVVTSLKGCERAAFYLESLLAGQIAGDAI